MKKLLLIGSNSTHLWRYLNMIRDVFDNITVITNKPVGNAITACNEIIVLNFSLRDFFSFIETVKSIKNKIYSFRPDIIHVHQANTIAFATMLANRNFNLPIILTAWGSDILVVPNRGSFYKAMVKFNLRHATICTADSHHVANIMRKLVPDKNLSIIVANFGIGVIPDTSISKENIIYSNRLHKPMYRIDVIIKEFKRFIENQKELWRLVIAGHGEQTENLKKLVKTMGIEKYVDFVGWLDAGENAFYYNKSKIYVSIPTNDATSIGLLEAMACGCIPVVSDLPANHEWIVDGLNGVIVEDLDTPFLERALDINVDLMRKINNFLIKKKATVETNREKYLSIYEGLLGGK